MTCQRDRLNAIHLQAEIAPVNTCEYLYQHEVRVVHQIQAADIELESQQYGDSADIFKEGALFVLKSIYGDEA